MGTDSTLPSCKLHDLYRALQGFGTLEEQKNESASVRGDQLTAHFERVNGYCARWQFRMDLGSPLSFKETNSSARQGS